MPHQLGVVAKGGAEAIIHAIKAFLGCISDSQALIKLDFCNAFNTFRRDCFLEAVVNTIPELILYISSSYKSSSTLRFGDFTLESAEGIQQGDPLGPLLFSISIAGLLNDCTCLFTAGFLDDITLGDDVSVLISEVARLQSRANVLGLSPNSHKCEILSLSSAANSIWLDAGLQFHICSQNDATLLGSPFTTEATEDQFIVQNAHVSKFRVRLKQMTPHEALFFLKSCLGMPRFLFLIRTAFCIGSPAVAAFDLLLRDALGDVTNTVLDDLTWSQASLPVRWGGLGV